MHERKGALMRGEPRKEDLINIPNVLCYIRILLVPVFIVLFLKEMYWQSGLVIMIATATHTKITTISGRIFLMKNGTEKLKWQEKESLKNKSREKRLLFF